MSTPTPERTMTVYTESSRAMQAIAAEMGDYSKRFLADGISTFNQMASARTGPEFVALMAAFTKRAVEENAQQMSRVANMYATAIGDQTRTVQSMMMPRQR